MDEIHADPGVAKRRTAHLQSKDPGSNLTQPSKHSVRNLRQLRAGFVLVPFCHAAGMNVVTVLAFRFMTDNLAISAGAAGVLFAMVKIYDGLIDPAMGAWTDRITTRWGRRLPFIFAGGILMPLSIAMVFGAPDLGSILITQAITTLALLVHATAYTALTIPGFAMAIEASDNFDERTSLMAYRVFGNSLGMLAGTALPASLLGLWGATRNGHFKMAMVIGTVIFIAAMLATWLLRNAPRTDPGPKLENRPRYSLKAQLHLAWDNQPFRILAIAHIFVLFGVSVTSAASAYYSKYVLEFPDSYLASFYLALTVGSVASMPCWVFLSRKTSKKFAYILAMGLYGCMHLLWLTASGTEPIPLLIARSVVTGVAVGGTILCAYSMMTDAIRFDYIKSQLRREGAFAGFTTLLDKLSAAMAVALMGAFLGAMGYLSSTSADAQQPESAILAITLCVAVVPFATMAIAIFVVLGYSLREDMLKEADNPTS